MESHGLPGKIQASASTAELIRSWGKEHWVIEREGGIEAKGKGRLQTFWIEPSSKASAHTTTTSTDKSSTCSGASTTEEDPRSSDMTIESDGDD